MLKKSNQKGFTIIEVLIVLAIAALIMVVVFLAIPALQRNQRNSSRTSEASRISALVSECLANRNGQTASCGSNAALGITPGTDTKQIESITYDAGAASTTNAVVTYATVCNPDTSGTSGGTARQFTVVYQLEPTITKCLGS